MKKLPFFLLAILIALALPSGAVAEDYSDFTDVELVDCYDGDTCDFNLDFPGVPEQKEPDLFTEEVPVRFKGYDTPEIRGECPREKRLAKRARDKLKGVLEQAERIELRNPERGKYFRVVAEVVADGKPVKELLIEADLAKPYGGDSERPDWCS